MIKGSIFNVNTQNVCYLEEYQVHRASSDAFIVESEVHL